MEIKKEEEYKIVGQAGTYESHTEVEFGQRMYWLQQIEMECL